MSSLLFTLVILEWIVTTKFYICTNPVSFVGAFQQFPPKQKLIIKSQQQLLNDERKRRRRKKVTTKFRIFKMIFSAMFVYLQLFETTTKRNFLHFKSSFESSQTLKYLIIGFFTILSFTFFTYSKPTSLQNLSLYLWNWIILHFAKQHHIWKENVFEKKNLILPTAVKAMAMTN
jgi:hypothetical protein